VESQLLLPVRNLHLVRHQCNAVVPRPVVVSELQFTKQTTSRRATHNAQKISYSDLDF